MLLLLAPFIQAYHKPSHQSPPLDILAVGQPIQCGAVYDHIIILKKAWEADKNLMKKGIRSPLFKEDFMKLQYFQDLFILAGCRSI